MSRLDSAVGHLLRGVAAACLAALAVVVGYVVVTRVAGLRSAGWTDELIEFLFAWLVFSGTASLWREKGHFAVDLLLLGLEPGRARNMVKLVGEALCLFFLVVFVWQALVFIIHATDASPVFAISKIYWYGIMPVAGGIMAVYSAVRIGRLLLRGEEQGG